MQISGLKARDSCQIIPNNRCNVWPFWSKTD